MTIIEEENIISINNLTKKFPSSEGKEKYIKAIDNISFNIKKGEILGLLGPNGAGKTTLVKMISTLIRPDKGHIQICGLNNFANQKTILKKISTVLEGNRNIYWRLTVKENIDFFAALKGKDPNDLKEKINKYLEIFDLMDKLNTPARNLSRGMKQKLSLVISFLTGNEIIILDEPTLGLDVKTSQEIKFIIKNILNKDKTVIITTHDMSFVQDVCKRVIILNKGKIIKNDMVENLLTYFTLNLYKIIIKNQLSERSKNQLQKIEFLKLKEKKDSTILTVNAKKSSVLYNVINILEKNNLIIKNINSIKPSFQEIFIDIINNRREY